MQVAEDVGTAREVVVRLLGELVREGILQRRGRGRYAVLEAKRLGAMAARE